MTTQILDHSPDKILYNGNIVCVDKDFGVAKAVAIKNGRFTGVGEDKDILNLASPQTSMIDLQGRTVLPGLIDTHNHMTQAGLGMIQLSLEGSTCIADIVKLVDENVRDTAPGEWVTTALIGEPAINHLLKEGRYPTCRDLDPVSPDNPVCIVSFHVLIVNSCALRLADIDRNTPDPDGGRIDMDPETGEPTGIFYEEPAMALIRRHLPQITYQDKLNGLREACRQYNAVGLTGICEHGLDFEELKAYQELWRNGELSVRSYLHIMIDPDQTIAEIENMIKTLGFIASPGFGDSSLKIGGLKLIFDGGVGIGTALMREPFMTDSGKVSNGVQVISTEKFQEIVRLVSRYNLRLAQHDSGGKAIDMVLDVYDQIHNEQRIDDKRFVMVHCQFPTRENFDKIRKLGVVVVTQTTFLYSMGLRYLKYLGKDLADTAIPLRDWMDTGLPVSLSSDAPVTPFNPFLGIWHAVTRKEKTTSRVIGPEQRITRKEAIRCYTINSAYASFDEHLKGSIEPGKLADLVILDRDILTCPVDEIKETKVLMTIIGGEVVFEITS
jgi:predicted amidohydrolase YtcJ